MKSSNLIKNMKITHPRFNTLRGSTAKVWKPKTFITASKLPFLLGFFENSDDRDTWWYSKGSVSPPYVPNKHMDWGNENEAKVIKIVLDHFKDITVELPQFKHLDYGPFAGRMGAEPDGMIYREGKLVGVLEIKCPSPYVGGNFTMGVQPHRTVPARYFSQIQCEMAISGVSTALYCSWTLGGCRMFEISRDETYFNEMLDMLAMFETWYNTRNERVREIESILVKFREKTTVLAEMCPLIN